MQISGTQQLLDLADKYLWQLSVKQLRAIGSKHFNGSLGGVSTKRDMIREMMSCLRHWANNDADELFNAAWFAIYNEAGDKR